MLSAQLLSHKGMIDYNRLFIYRRKGHFGNNLLAVNNHEGMFLSPNVVHIPLQLLFSII
ncbi:hypothetical protein D3C73_1587080 [compost metagenome]